MIFGKSYPPVKARRPKSRAATLPDSRLRSGGRADRGLDRAMIALGMPPEILEAFHDNGLEALAPELVVELIRSGQQNEATLKAAIAEWARDDNDHIAAYSRATNEVLLVKFVLEPAK